MDFPAERVCDDFSDCTDGTDERNCSLIHQPENLIKTETPPTILKDGKLQPIILNATFNVIKVFGINEVDSTFDLHFLLEIQWYHQPLRFEFLKLNDYHNFLREAVKVEKIKT